MMLQTLQSVLTLPANATAPSQKHETSGYFHERSFDSEELAVLVKDYEIAEVTASDNSVEHDNLYRISNNTKRRFATVLAAASVAALCACAGSFSGLQTAGNVAESHAESGINKFSTTAMQNVDHPGFGRQSGMRMIAEIGDTNLDFIENFQAEFDSCSSNQPNPIIREADLMEKRRNVALCFVNKFIRNDLPAEIYGPYSERNLQVYYLDRHFGGALSNENTGRLRAGSDDHLREKIVDNLKKLQQFVNEYTEYIIKNLNPDFVPASGSSEDRVAEHKGSVKLHRSAAEESVNLIHQFVLLTREKMQLREVNLSVSATSRRMPALQSSANDAEKHGPISSGLPLLPVSSGMRLTATNASETIESNEFSINNVKHVWSGESSGKRKINWEGREVDLGFIGYFQEDFYGDIYNERDPTDQRIKSLGTEQRATVAVQFVKDFVRNDAASPSFTFADWYSNSSKIPFEVAFKSWLTTVNSLDNNGALTCREKGFFFK